jgi:hypothetical protein
MPLASIPNARLRAAASRSSLGPLDSGKSTGRPTQPGGAAFIPSRDARCPTNLWIDVGTGHPTQTSFGWVGEILCLRQFPLNSESGYPAASSQDTSGVVTGRFSGSSSAPIIRARWRLSRAWGSASAMMGSGMPKQNDCSAKRSRGRRKQTSHAYWPRPGITSPAGRPSLGALGAPLAHLESSTYLGPRKPLAAQCKHPIGVNLSAWPSELLAFRPCIAQASSLPLLA